ncbi:hypothetical protein AB0469_00145 [Streptomyces sp. NPDC093801]|uniref:hypothetical protein n=1 Tax=Streptomyces sp. NPDC093801 TaxID=3155203 RepID=UPI00344FF938
MGTHDGMQRGAAPLTTEDLAGPGTGRTGTGPPVYPGEATGETLSGGSAADRDEQDERTGAGRTDGVSHDLSHGVSPDGSGDGSEEGSGEGRTAGRLPGEPREGREGTGTAADGGDGQPLLATGDAERYRTAWGEIQGRFVDDPREAVTSADTLVAEVMQSLAGTFASHKQELEGQWQRGDDVATEDLRQALQHYRSFFNRLLNA